MKLRPFAALSLALSFALMACAKKSAAPPVSAAPPAPSSHVSIAMASSGIKAELTGPTFAQFDPTSRQLTVFAFRADSSPTPSCEDLSAFKLTTGGLVTLQVPKFAQGEGTFFVLGAGYFEQDPKTEKLTMGADTLSATLIDVRAYDENTITAEIRTTAAEDAPRASGAVVATMCPPKEVLFAGGSSSSTQGNMRSSGGPRAPRLEGRSVNGDRVAVSLDALKGKVVIVDFWATWCGPCNSWFPRLVEFEAKYRSRGVVVIGVSLDDQATPIPGFAKKYGVTFPLVWDQGKHIASLWRPSGIPSTFVIDRTGAVSYHHEGFSDNDERDLESAVKKVF